jgi:hypothetical protein
MNRKNLGIYLYCSILILSLLAVSRDISFIILLSGLDISLFIIFFAVNIVKKRGNILAPSLWAMMGYILFGQLPIVINGCLGIYDTIGYSSSSISAMGTLILLGYRALIVGIFWTLGADNRIFDANLPAVNLIYPVVLIIAGALTRIFIGNNITGWSIEYRWYHSFLFTFTPIGVCLLFARSLKHGWKKVEGVEKYLIIFSVIVALGTGICDVSRKDTGMILLSIIIFGYFKVRPQFPFLNTSIIRSAKLGFLLFFLGIVLMGTRALSWSVANNTGLWSELKTSFNERRANDVTEILTFVIETTPEVYPYLYGRTLGSLIPIPRILYADRVPAHSYYVGLEWRGVFMYEFDPRFMGDNQLSISAHMLGEGYANFGVIGAILFELGLGGLIGLYEKQLKQGKLVVLRILFPVILFFILTQQRGDIAMMNSAWIQSAVILFTILFLTKILEVKKASKVKK